MSIDVFKWDISPLFNKYGIQPEPLIMKNIINLLPHLTDRELENLYRSASKNLGRMTKEVHKLRAETLNRKNRKKGGD